MTLRPLPVPTRLFGGEGVETYSRRAAERNGTDARWIEKALWDMDIVRSLSPRHPTRLQAWRELGGLRDDAFVMPDTIGGDWVTDRFFCRVCTAGLDVRGRAPHVGLVCVRHKRGSSQIAVDCWAAFDRRLTRAGISVKAGVEEGALGLAG